MELTEKEIWYYLDKAEQYVGDIMYEFCANRVRSDDSETIMREVEMMSDEDLRYCRYESFFSAGVYDQDIIEQVLDYWEKRGF